MAKVEGDQVYQFFHQICARPTVRRRIVPKSSRSWSLRGQFGRLDCRSQTHIFHLATNEERKDLRGTLSSLTRASKDVAGSTAKLWRRRRSGHILGPEGHEFGVTWQ
jgi:hypothetical protein